LCITYTLKSLSYRIVKRLKKLLIDLSQFSCKLWNCQWKISENRRERRKGRSAINVEIESTVFRTYCSSSSCIDSIDASVAFSIRLHLPHNFSRGEVLRSLNGTLSLLQCDLPLNFDIYPLVAVACCNDWYESTMIITLSKQLWTFSFNV